MDRHLHIISFTVPYPVNYGGVFDIFHKIAALNKAGIKIHLHCFTEKNRRQPELDQYCYSVDYYPRKTGFKGISWKLPYIVSSRMDKALWKRLNEDDFPVLIEGVHAAGWLLSNPTRKRKIILRLFNVEHDYYRQLSFSTSSISRRTYFYLESLLLKRFEQRIAGIPDRIIALSNRDAKKYNEDFGATNIETLPVFTGFTYNPPEGKGLFCLYHGNLSVPENEKAVAWLLIEVFADLNVPLVIAGKNPSGSLQQLIQEYKNVRLVSNPTREEMQVLIADAQCNVLPSFNNTGVKLKLINALFHGRHCVVNPAAVDGSGLENICQVASAPEEFARLVQQLFARPMSEQELLERKIVLEDLFNEEKNCATLIQRIW